MPEAPPRTLDDLNKAVQHNMTPDPNWEATGEIHTDSAGNKYTVYRETVPVTEQRPARDVDGNILYHLRADGSRHRAMMETVEVGETTREFTLVPLGNGLTQKNYHFRPSPEEVARKEAAVAEKRAVSELGRALKESGQSFSDIVSGMKKAVGIEPREEDVGAAVPMPREPADTDEAPAAEDGPEEEATAPGDYPKMYGPGMWYLTPEHEDAVQAGEEEPFRGKKTQALAAADRWQPAATEL